jgi:elongator complex protein 2
LSGHESVVNAVKFFPADSHKDKHLLSASADGTIRCWQNADDEKPYFRPVGVVGTHEASVNCIAVLSGSDLFATGAADATVRIWRRRDNPPCSEEVEFELVQKIDVNPKFFPLSVALSYLDESKDAIILAVAGTKSTVQIYVSENNHFQLSATLTGHEGWIRALAFTTETTASGSDLLLASTSQDRYIRLWRVHQGTELPAASRAANDPALGVLGRSLSNKAHRFAAKSKKYSITFEALLLGHEDWIYTAQWQRWNGRLQLLSASADNSLAIWEADESSGIWVSIARLGEISSQKGSTTATGSTGGFWIGLWSPNADAVVSLGRTGSWRMWKRIDALGEQWAQAVGISGHTKEVRSLAWSPNGAYLLSTGIDQTTRLHAEWKRGDSSSIRTWHEFSRPQIHGYDMNCIDTISDTQFISGADEKLLRVFDEPAAVAEVLATLCGIEKPRNVDELPEAANIPVLGLSNKAISTIDEEGEDAAATKGAEGDNYCESPDPALISHKSTLKITHPPLEDTLSRHTLWPETEKLYGHGYEISCCATSPDGTLVATACRASSIDHAVIRLYDTREWRQIDPPLKAHALTVTNLEFSDDAAFLLSVGRDRQWAVFARSNNAETPNAFACVWSNPKGHSRMILDCSWAPSGAGRVFATAGRDKAVKLWRMSRSSVDCVRTISAVCPVTAVAFLPHFRDEKITLGYGLEDGSVVVQQFAVDNLEPEAEVRIEKSLSPSKAITRLAWRPRGEDGSEDGLLELAVASDDTSLRIYSIRSDG